VQHDRLRVKLDMLLNELRRLNHSAGAELHHPLNVHHMHSAYATRPSA
jgi:hypothetical protein